jgi:hypothetical protein
VITLKSAFMATLTAAFFSAAPAYAAPSGEVPAHKGTAAQPADPTANLPSATGAQTTTPGGAVTGAGHAQADTNGSGTGEGLQGRAVAEERPIVEEKRAREAQAAGEPAIGGTSGRGASGSVRSGPASH